MCVIATDRCLLRGYFTIRKGGSVEPKLPEEECD